MIDEVMIKEYINSVCKRAEFIELYLYFDSLVINMADTAIAFIELGYNSGIRALIDRQGNQIYNRGIEQKIQGYIGMVNVEYPVVANIEDLRSIPEYEALLDRKSDDGAGFFKIPGDMLYEYYILPVFTGFPVLNKQDKVGITVRRMSHSELLMTYHIYKKKINKNVNMHFRTLDLNRTLIGERQIV